MRINISKEKLFVVILQGISALVMILYGKLIAVNFSPEQYGIYTLQFAVFIFFNAFFISPFLQYIKTKNNTINRKYGYGTYFKVLPILVLLVVLFTYYSLYIKGDITSSLFVFLVSIFCLSDSIVKMKLDQLNTNGSLVRFGFLSCANKLILLFVIYIILLSYDFVDINIGSDFIWCSLAFSSALTLIVSFLGCGYTNKKSKNSLAISMHYRKMLRYAVPLSIMSIWSWCSSYFDRFLIEHYLGYVEVGLYNASFGLGSKFFSLIAPIFLVILTPYIYSNISKENKKNKIDKSIKIYLITGLILIVLVEVFKEGIGSLLLSHSYSEGFFVISGVNFAYFLLTTSYLYELYFYSESKTKIILYTNVISAVIGISMSFFLIPLYGLVGALVATIICFFSKLILTFYYYRKV